MRPNFFKAVFHKPLSDTFSRDTLCNGQSVLEDIEAIPNSLLALLV
jgi:hypothetical protein